MNASIRVQRGYLLGLGALSWFALGLQLYLSIRMSLSRGDGVAHGVSMYFAFFTVLTNILVAVVLTMPLLAPRSRIARFTESPQTVAGVAVNIALVGIVYNLLLRTLWHPHGLQLFGDVLLHDLIPIAFVTHAWLLGHDAGAGFMARARWLAWPAAYLAYALLRGAVSGFYPYPFLNVAQLGYGVVLLNSIGIALGYLVLCAIMTAIERARPTTR